MDRRRVTSNVARLFKIVTGNGAILTDQLQLLDLQRRQVCPAIKDEEPWLVEKDICDVVEISNPGDAVKRLEGDGRTLSFNRSIQQCCCSHYGQRVWSIPSNSLSREKEAKAFEHCSAHRVISSIHKTWSYINQVSKSYQPQLENKTLLMKGHYRERGGSLFSRESLSLYLHLVET
jgi:prophage antirepressor-like protein